VRLTVLNESDEEVHRGTVGEIAVRGSTVAAYYNDQPSTDAASRSGWHHTGDVGYIDDDGFVFIVDRKKDVIKTGGYSVFTMEIEACIRDVTGVADCAVVGVPDELLGEAAIAYIVLLDSSVTVEQIRQYCIARLGNVKAPKHFDVVVDLPLTAMGKVDKRKLRIMYFDQRSDAAV
jgi:acyl-CoA synthetase (AMP-forming)/AMP-acid ligase II